jgi:hypothetical protein
LAAIWGARLLYVGGLPSSLRSSSRDRGVVAGFGGWVDDIMRIMDVVLSSALVLAIAITSVLGPPDQRDAGHRPVYAPTLNARARAGRR